MSQEQIKIKSEKDITVSTFFTNVDANKNDIKNSLLQYSTEGNNIRPSYIWNVINSEGEDAYAIKGSDGKVLELIENIEGSCFKRKENSNEYTFLQENELKSVIKGKKYTLKNKTKLDDNFKIKSVDNFIRDAKSYSGDSSYSNIFFKEEKKTDYNVDICIHRTIDTLDTLSVKNNPLSNYPTQQSETGVVTGTLYAKQKILNENGERVLIPLSNVPIIIFNPSEEYPEITSLDENGNRITLNLLENSEPNDYEGVSSFVLDVGTKYSDTIIDKSKTEDFTYTNPNPLLKTVNATKVPEYYKYSTITNENGEFILHDIPVGNQNLMFEVDLLKQGMTKDEVSLNIFPYPTEENP